MQERIAARSAECRRTVAADRVEMTRALSALESVRWRRAETLGSRPEHARLATDTRALALRAKAGTRRPAFRALRATTFFTILGCGGLGAVDVATLGWFETVPTPQIRASTNGGLEPASRDLPAFRHKEGAGPACGHPNGRTQRHGASARFRPSASARVPVRDAPAAEELQLSAPALNSRLLSAGPSVLVARCFGRHPSYDVPNRSAARRPAVGTAAVAQCMDLPRIADSCKAAVGGV
jgi:hypothetical protein